MNQSSNPFHEKITPENCALLLIDHQTGTMLGVQDISASGTLEVFNQHLPFYGFLANNQKASR